MLVASLPAGAALTGAAKKPRRSIEELLNQLPPEVATDLRAKLTAILSYGLARLRAGENKYVVLADVRAQIRAAGPSAPKRARLKVAGHFHVAGLSSLSSPGCKGKPASLLPLLAIIVRSASMNVGLR